MMEIEFEKVFKKLMIPKIRGGTEGSKKRYAGILETKDVGEKLDFTGLEFVRSDWTEVSKHFQMKLLDMIFHGKKVEVFINNFVDDIKDFIKDNS